MDLKDSIQKYKDGRVWVTKKCRIEAESRMLFFHRYVMVLINYYTFLVLGISIYSLAFSGAVPEMVNIISVLISIALFGISLYTSAHSYKDKANSYKECYIKLMDIESELESLLLKLNGQNSLMIESEFKRIKKDYKDIIEKDNNHANIDHLKYLKNQNKLNISSWWKYYSIKTLKMLLIIISFIFPLGYFVF